LATEDDVGEIEACHLAAAQTGIGQHGDHRRIAPPGDRLRAGLVAQISIMAADLAPRRRATGGQPRAARAWHRLDPPELLAAEQPEVPRRPATPRSATSVR
jgi:hypothetical protein